MPYPGFREDEKEGVEDMGGGDRLLSLFRGGPSVTPIRSYPPPLPILRRVPVADSHNHSQLDAIGLGELEGPADRSERDRHPRLVLHRLRESPDGCLGYL